MAYASQSRLRLNKKNIPLLSHRLGGNGTELPMALLSFRGGHLRGGGHGVYLVCRGRSVTLAMAHTGHQAPCTYRKRRIFYEPFGHRGEMLDHSIWRGGPPIVGGNTAHLPSPWWEALATIAGLGFVRDRCPTIGMLCVRIVVRAPCPPTSSDA